MSHAEEMMGTTLCPQDQGVEAASSSSSIRPQDVANGARSFAKMLATDKPLWRVARITAARMAAEFTAKNSANTSWTSTKVLERGSASFASAAAAAAARIDDSDSQGPANLARAPTVVDFPDEQAV
eukprot:s712_g8.t1